MVSHSASFGTYLSKVHCVCEPSQPIHPNPKEEGRAKILKSVDPLGWGGMV